MVFLFIFVLTLVASSSLVCLPPPPASSKTWHHPLRGGGNPLSLYQLAKRRFKAPSSASGRTFRSDPLTPTTSNLYTLSTLSSLLSTEEEIYKYSKNVIKWPKNRKKGGVNTVNTVNTGFFPKHRNFLGFYPSISDDTVDSVDTLRVCYLVVLTVMTVYL